MNAKEVRTSCPVHSVRTGRVVACMIGDDRLQHVDEESIRNTIIIEARARQESRNAEESTPDAPTDHLQGT